MRGISIQKSPPKVSACADFRRKFVTTNLQTSVSTNWAGRQPLCALGEGDILDKIRAHGCLSAWE